VVAPVVQFGFLAIGGGIFLDRCQSLLSDAQFTWGERMVTGGVALLSLGGAGFAGWISARLIRVAADVVEVLADGADSALHTNELIERNVVPALARIAIAIERRAPEPEALRPRERPHLERP
jgi:hypothetical protein